MNIYYIFLAVFAVATVVFTILARFEKGILFSSMSFLTILLTLLSTVLSIALPLLAKKDILIFEATKTYITFAESFVDDDVIQERMDKANAWLVEAKQDLEAFGIFSKYYTTNLKELEPIVINKE